MTTGHVQGDALAGHLLGGRYRLESLLGRGGMANVYRATDEVLHRRVAVKLFGDASDDAHSARAATEVRLLAALNHPALVTLYDARVTADEDAFLVMELVEGPTLRDRIAGGAVARVDIATMAADLAEALHAVHEAGMVHRDVKPSNVLLAPSVAPTREFRAKLADFGIAHLVDSARLTTPGTIMGTAAYLSPEQTRGVTPAPPGDVYSLGLVLLETFTRERAFPGGLAESLVARVQRDPVVPGDVGYAWKSLLTAMTSRTPDARPTALDVAAAAREILRAEGTGPLVVTDTVALETTGLETRSLETRGLVTTSLATARIRSATGSSAVRSAADDSPADDVQADDLTVPTDAVPSRRARRAAPVPARRRSRGLILAAAAVLAAIGLGAGVASWITGGRPGVSASDAAPVSSSLEGVATTLADVSAGVVSLVTERQAAAAEESGTEAVPVTDTDPTDDTDGTVPTDDTEQPTEDETGTAPSPEQPVTPDTTSPDPVTPDTSNPGGNGNGNGNGPGNNSGKGKGAGG
jgi:serine/threonine protein kinase